MLFYYSSLFFENVKDSSPFYFVHPLSKFFTTLEPAAKLSLFHLLLATTPFNPVHSVTAHPLNLYQSVPQIGVNQKTFKRKPDLLKFLYVKCHIVDKEKRMGSIPTNSDLDFHDLY